MRASFSRVDILAAGTNAPSTSSLAGGSATNRCDSRSTAEGDRAEDLGALAEHAGGHRDRARRRDRRAPHDVADRVEQEVAGAGQLAADDHPLRREQVARPRDREAERAAGVSDHALAAEVALDRHRDDAPQRDPVAVAAAQRLEHGLSPANASRQPRLPQRQTGPRSSIVTWPSSPARATRALVEAAVEHQPGADAGRRPSRRRRRSAASRAPHDLGERAEVGVVLDANGEPELRLHELLRASADPAGQDRRVADLPVSRRSGPGTPCRRR